MIKGIGFGKLLKQFCFILLISCFIGLGSFSSAGQVSQVGNYISSSYNDQYNINILSRGSFLTQYMGYTKNVFYMSNQNFLAWKDGNIYGHMCKTYRGSCEQYYEGFVNQYFICNVLTGLNSVPVDCQFYSVFTGTINYYKDFLKTVNTSDYFYQNMGYYQDYNTTRIGWIDLCISSFSLNKSICWSFQYNDDGYSCHKSFADFCPSSSNSLGLGAVDFSDLNFGLSPAVDGSIDGGNSSANIGTLGDNQNIIQCTLNTALHWYKYKGYSDKLCYGGLDDYSILGSDDFIPIYGQGIYLTDLYNNTKTLRAKGHTGTEMSKSAWFDYWRNLYKGYKNGMYSINPFNDNPAVLFTYFGAVDVYGGFYNDESILEYCKISSHNGDLSALYSGVNYNSVCNWSPISVIQDTVEGELSGSGYNEWANGDVSIGASWDGVLSGGITFTNGKTFISDTFNRLKDNFLLPVGNGGIFGVLPGYIILAMLGLILFRFLSH